MIKYAFTEMQIHVVALISMALLILSSCAPRVIPGPVYFYPKVEPVDIELKNFSLYPNHIAILKGDGHHSGDHHSSIRQPSYQYLTDERGTGSPGENVVTRQNSISLRREQKLRQKVRKAGDLKS